MSHLSKNAVLLVNAPILFRVYIWLFKRKSKQKEDSCRNSQIIGL